MTISLLLHALVKSPKLKHYIEEHGLRFYLNLSLLKVFMFYDNCFFTFIDLRSTSYCT